MALTSDACPAHFVRVNLTRITIESLNYLGSSRERMKCANLRPPHASLSLRKLKIPPMICVRHTINHLVAVFAYRATRCTTPNGCAVDTCRAAQCTTTLLLPSPSMALIVDPELPRKYRRLRHVIRERVRTAAAPCVGWEWDIVFMLDLDPAHGIALLSRAHDVAVARRWKTAPCAPRLPPT